MNLKTTMAAVMLPGHLRVTLARSGSPITTDRIRWIFQRTEWGGHSFRWLMLLVFVVALLGTSRPAFFPPGGEINVEPGLGQVHVREDNPITQPRSGQAPRHRGMLNEAIVFEGRDWFTELVPVKATNHAVREQQEESLADRVTKAIDKGVAFLRSQENGKGHWEVDGETPARQGARSSLAMLALLQAGVKTDDPMMIRGMAFLRKIALQQIYTVSLQTMVFVQAGFAEDRPLIKRNVDWLIRLRIPARSYRGGGWGYVSLPGAPDNTNSRFALMAIHGALKTGIAAPEAVMKEIEEDLRNTQHKDGGWTHRNDPFSNYIMTFGGLASLINIRNDLRQGTPGTLRDGVEEDCGTYEEGSAIRKGLDWLRDSFPARIPNSDMASRFFRQPYYALQALEWTGEASGERFFGGHDWYRVGSNFLVLAQSPDGSWGDSGEITSLDSSPVVATSCSLGFLAGGRPPVLIAKLAHGKDGGGNRKRSDLRHLVPFVSRQIFSGRPLAWQNFDTTRIPLNEEKALQNCSLQLLESPVVWLSGHNLELSGEQFRLLKSYVEGGGFLFAEACCASKEFDAQFRTMIKKMFPGQELTLLPKDHPLWKASGAFSTSSEQYPLYGIIQGGKVVVVYSPRVISGYWETNRQTEGPGLEAFRLGANVIAYATDKKMPLPRLSQPLLPER